MTIESINATSFVWDNLAAEKFDGQTGFATVRTQIVGNIKIRKVEYSPGYLADHWCEKGHIVLIVAGQLIIEHQDETEVRLDSGSTYVVGDNSMAHKARSTVGALAFIVD